MIDYVQEPSMMIKGYLKFVTNYICFENGHYVIGLTFKAENVIMAKNKKQTDSLCTKFEGTSEFNGSYKALNDKFICNGNAQRIPTRNLHQYDGRVWYLPHHNVFHPKKKKKIRVAFDCAIEFKRTSLNKQLLQGPYLTNTLVGTRRNATIPQKLKGAIQSPFSHHLVD